MIEGPKAQPVSDWPTRIPGKGRLFHCTPGKKEAERCYHQSGRFISYPTCRPQGISISSSSRSQCFILKNPKINTLTPSWRRSSTQETNPRQG
ncbi:hypothetical protein XELAEV_18034288mg [Xenopus laevis]|uniref:Uncharacterized protein n=1 Tax=Xenopus laevis TaxID=8355 RepID=A0A974CEV4_XENLA|nr:hypothetical protein XELAEV_18034288mg [Xenopus laevis]